MKTAQLRKIDVQVVRVNPRGHCSPSLEYVFAIRPRQSASTNVRPHSVLYSANTPVVHEVSHPYSNCRVLYNELRHLTDCKNVRACCCVLGSCPFWSLHAMLRRMKFPRRTLLNYQSKSVCSQRTQRLNTMMDTLLAVLRTKYAMRHFRCYPVSSGTACVCKVLMTLCQFFELDHADVEKRLLEGDERVAYRMNLHGWQTDRRNLYFHGNDKSEYRTIIKCDNSARWNGQL